VPEQEEKLQPERAKEIDRKGNGVELSERTALRSRMLCLSRVSQSHSASGSEAGDSAAIFRPGRLRELLRDVIQRDIATRQGLRETRHLMNLCLFLLANTGLPLSMQTLTKSLAIPSVSQTSRYLAALEDAYLILPLQKFSTSFKKRIVAPPKYYPIDNGLRRANSPQSSPDIGRRLETLVFLALRSKGEPLSYAGEKDLWECDFVTSDCAIQVCAALTPENQERERRGLTAAAKLPGSSGQRRSLVLTLDQKDTLANGEISILPVWEWLD
jgi:hypothetical protein